MEMRLPRSVVEIIDRLESLGYEAYAVGGCVRDTLLGREPEVVYVIIESVVWNCTVKRIFE